ncbi:MAG: tetratricopeptide repeat protein [Bacteroidetes bacterium]|nr:tetratricopeptide repeat protein [Bacteroidota bacterium]
MRKILIVVIFFLISGNSLFAQVRVDSLPYLKLFKQYTANLNKNIDSAEIINLKLEEIAIKKGDNYFLALFQFHKSIIAYYKNDFKLAKNNALSAIKISKKYGNYNVLMRSQNILGAIYFIEGDIITSERWYNERLKIALILNDTTEEMQTYYNLGLIYSQSGRYLETAKNTFKAIKYFESKKDSLNLLFQLQSLGVTYYHLDDEQNALNYLYKAIDLGKKLKNNYQVAGLYVDISNVFFDTLNYSKNDSVLKYLNNAIDLSKKENDEFHYAIALNSLAAFYTKNKKFIKAIEYAKQAMQLNILGNRLLGLTGNYEVICDAYYNLNELDSALYYARKGLSTAKTQNQKENLLKLNLIISKVFEKKRVFDSSLYYHQQYFTFYTTLQKTLQLRGIAKQELVFEKENQDQLRAKEKLIAQTKLEKQKQINTIVIVASVLLSVLLIISFINFKQKQKANLEVLKQKKLLEDKQKEIHDSIVYASRIQKSLMPTNKYLKKKIHD